MCCVNDVSPDTEAVLSVSRCVLEECLECFGPDRELPPSAAPHHQQQCGKGEQPLLVLGTCIPGPGLVPRGVNCCSRI